MKKLLLIAISIFTAFELRAVEELVKKTQVGASKWLIIKREKAQRQEKVEKPVEKATRIEGVETVTIEPPERWIYRMSLEEVSGGESNITEVWRKELPVYGPKFPRSVGTWREPVFMDLCYNDKKKSIVLVAKLFTEVRAERIVFDGSAWRSTIRLESNRLSSDRLAGSGGHILVNHASIDCENARITLGHYNQTDPEESYKAVFEFDGKKWVNRPQQE